MTTEQPCRRAARQPTPPTGGGAGTTLHAPPAARPAWERLGRALLDYAPPCAADPDRWWSTDADDLEASIHECRRCHVLKPCGQYADAAAEPFGVWAAVDRATVRQVDTAC